MSDTLVGVLITGGVAILVALISLGGVALGRKWERDADKDRVATRRAEEDERWKREQAAERETWPRERRADVYVSITDSWSRRMGRKTDDDIGEMDMQIAEADIFGSYQSRTLSKSLQLASMKTQFEGLSPEERCPRRSRHVP